MTERTTPVDTAWTIGKVAQTFGVTVRTLHHYDDIGLLTPSARSASGYRLYTSADLTRLQQIVVYRRLEMPLDDIADLINSGEPAAVHLQRQRESVMSRLNELTELVEAIDRAMEKEMSNEQLSPAEMKELFGDGFDESYAEEAQQRWGETDAWKQSQQRTAAYTKSDWEEVKAETQAVNDAFAAAMDAGLAADSDEAAQAAELHRQSIARFYDCDYAMQRNLADMYLADPRFTKTYEEVRPGMAQYVRDAIHANADRHAG